MKILRAWLRASRLPSQTFILFPILFGVSVAFSVGYQLNLVYLLAVLLFSIMIQLYIVYANDYADYELDLLNDTYTPFSGGSRVLVYNHLKREQIGLGAVVSGFLCLLLGFILTLSGRPYALILVFFSLTLLWLYSFKPVELSYRGGGEFLQMVGAGFILPLFGYYVISGDIQSFPFQYYLSLLPLNLGCAISTTLPDEPSDRRGGKRTLAVLAGRTKVQIAVITLHCVAVIFFVVVVKELILNLWIVAVIILPLISIIVMIVCMKKSRPGNKTMFAFVLFSILSTLSFTILITAAMLFGTHKSS
ncbi:prenyltransferase [Chitinispirillales bacterium ANBcel5]|uniref:prenyltransferase n=1 Tax=Cellulosispirillum alkaliphilum TaxID=3039283 RepID=UPI002A50E3EA|nr:prenyltransferase [Chitinispirillales bacterium ANBcel5]